MISRILAIGRVLGFLLGLLLVAAAAAYPSAPHRSFLLFAGCWFTGFPVLRATYRKKGTPWKDLSGEPMPARIALFDYGKALICWLDGFRHTYAVKPGLYYTGDAYDRQTPLLVTANYHLTFFLVVRRVRPRNVRILVVDTDGINAWCSSSEGRFSNEAIVKEASRYPRELLVGGSWLTMILPKVAFAGIDLPGLRTEKIRPIIGPVLARDLPAFLAKPKLTSRVDDRVRFGLQSRAFTWPPGFIQFMNYGFLLALAMILAEWLSGKPAPLGFLSIVAVIATLYPILYPWLPGTRFAVKGASLAAAFIAVEAGLALAGLLPFSSLAMAVPFTLATGIFFGLSYTGNSAVSNYSRVKKEIAAFFVPDLSLYFASLLVFILLHP